MISLKRLLTTLILLSCLTSCSTVSSRGGTAKEDAIRLMPLPANPKIDFFSQLSEDMVCLSTSDAILLYQYLLDIDLYLSSVDLIVKL